MRAASYDSLEELPKRSRSSATYIKDPRLRQVFTFQPLLIGGNPFNCPSIYLLIHWLERKWGVWFPKGGMGALVAAMGRLMEEIGIDIRLNSPVEHIDVDGKAKAVRMADGSTMKCDLIVSNAIRRWFTKRSTPNTARSTPTAASIASVNP